MSGNMEAVALAVLSRALHDACNRVDDIERGRPIRAKVVEEAREFWLSDEPQWREAREAWCDAAGWHPDYARARAMRQIAAAGTVERIEKPPSKPELIRREHAAGATVEDLAVRYRLRCSDVLKALSRKASRYA